jgi:hypothetical protein
MSMAKKRTGFQPNIRRVSGCLQRQSVRALKANANEAPSQTDERYLRETQ